MPGRSLQQLTKQRNERTGALTRSLTQLEQLVQGNAIPEMIQERMDDVEELYKDAQEVQRMIQAGMDDEEEVERELDMWEESSLEKYQQSVQPKESALAWLCRKLHQPPMQQLKGVG